MVLYDLSSSYFEGEKCPIAKHGYSRDGKPGTLQINFGLLCDREGRPISVSVFEGNKSDSKTFIPEVMRIKKRYKLNHIVMVGDRGMIFQTTIDLLKEIGKIDWITAMPASTIKKSLKKSDKKSQKISTNMIRYIPSNIRITLVSD